MLRIVGICCGLQGPFFCKVIRQVFCCWYVGDGELSLSNAIADPVHPHVDSFCSLPFNGIRCDANCSGIVAENDGCRLRVSNIFEDGVEGGGLLSCGEEGGVFSFSGIGDDARYDRRKTMNRSVYLPRKKFPRKR